MGSRRTYVALRRRAAIALAVWSVAFTMLAVAAALPEGPSASLTVDDAFPTVGQVVHFNASASTAHDAGNGRIVAYRFAFGDGQGTEWQRSPFAEHAYAAAGTFVATVTVIDNRGEEGTASVTIHPGTPPPPPVSAPDLVPIAAQVSPASPEVNGSYNVSVVVLNRGGGAADSADLVAYDLAPNGPATRIGTVPVPAPIEPSQTASVRLGPFVAAPAGNHTLRILVTNVTPPETNAANNELDVGMSVLPRSPPNGGGGGGGNGGGGGGGGAGGGLSVPLTALGLGAAAAIAAVSAGYLFLRPAPRGPLEPPPPNPPDRSPPPIWPP